jgi:hypothetical protein
LSKELEGEGSEGTRTTLMAERTTVEELAEMEAM